MSRREEKKGTYQLRVHLEKHREKGSMCSETGGVQQQRSHMQGESGAGQIGAGIKWEAKENSVLNIFQKHLLHQRQLKIHRGDHISWSAIAVVVTGVLRDWEGRCP